MLSMDLAVLLFAVVIRAAVGTVYAADVDSVPVVVVVAVVD